MIRKQRIPKTNEQRLSECEAHLYFLWDARRLYPEQRDRFKQIATEVRVLVCETGQNKPLLLNLMDEYGFSYEVQPPGTHAGGPPMKPQPLPMVGWRDDPVHQQLTDEIQEAINSGDEMMLQRIDERMAKLAAPATFRDWVNKGLAVYIKPYDYSHRDLVLAIAQQFGSSHEDDSVEEPIVQLQQIIIGGETGDIAPMIAFSEMVIQVGSLFIKHMVEHHEYNPRYFKLEAGKFPEPFGEGIGPNDYPV